MAMIFIICGCTSSSGLMTANNGYTYYLSDFDKCKTYKYDPQKRTTVILCYDSDGKYTGIVNALTQQQIQQYYAYKKAEQIQTHLAINRLANQLNQINANMQNQFPQNNNTIVNMLSTNNSQYLYLPKTSRTNNLKNNILNSNNGYTGMSGSRYKYDLNDPYQRDQYNLDLNSQMNDTFNNDVGTYLDRSVGQYGGGYY